MDVFILYRPGMVYRHSARYVDVFDTLEAAQRYPLETSPGRHRLTTEHTITRASNPELTQPGQPTQPTRPAPVYTAGLVFSWRKVNGPRGDDPPRWDLIESRTGYAGYSIVSKTLRTHGEASQPAAA